MRKLALFAAFKAFTKTKRLSVYEELAVIEALIDNPAMYLNDLQQHILHTTGKDSTANICKF